MNEQQIKTAVQQKLFRRFAGAPGVCVMEEVGICHGSARIDFLVVNGILHGFELKSDRDNLRRLENQIPAYNSVFDRVTLVVGYHLADRALAMVPDWWGVKLASVGLRGSISFGDARTPKGNPTIDKNALVKLLWLDQAVEVLRELGADAGMRSKGRKEVYARLVECSDLNFLREKTRYFLSLRQMSRVGGRQKLSDD